MNKIQGNRVIAGTFGEVWVDGELVAECYKCQAKVTVNKDDIKLCGQMAVDKKITRTAGTGSLGMYKVNSRMAKLVGEKIKQGHDPRFKVISKLDDPDAYGAERVVLKGVSMDDLTLADWEAGVAGKVEAPFTFTDYEFLDEIGV